MEALEYTGITGSPENKKNRGKKRTSLPGIQVRSMSAGSCLPVLQPLPAIMSSSPWGAHGAFHMEPSGKHALIPGCPARQVDATGAGDSHMGAVIACRMKGFPMDKAIRTANRISAAVVEHAGAGLDDEDFLRLNA